jgi:hypothetical protein
MNEEELKKLWQTAKSAPTIDFDRVEKTSNDIQKRLRRTVKIEIWVQIAVTVAAIIPVFFYPKMIFVALVTIALCIWYVPELRKLYQSENIESARLSVKDSLRLKIQTMKNFFRRTRFVTYIFAPFAYPLTQFGLGNYENSTKSVAVIVATTVITLIITEIVIIFLTEKYFKIVYKPVLEEWENLLYELEIS